MTYNDDDQGFNSYIDKLTNEGSMDKIQEKSPQKMHRLQPADPTLSKIDNWLVSKKLNAAKTDRLLAKHYYHQLMNETGRHCFYPITTLFPKE